MCVHGMRLCKCARNYLAVNMSNNTNVWPTKFIHSHIVILFLFRFTSLPLYRWLRRALIHTKKKWRMEKHVCFLRPPSLHTLTHLKRQLFTIFHTKWKNLRFVNGIADADMDFPDTNANMSLCVMCIYVSRDIVQWIRTPYLSDRLNMEICLCWP